jgi:hypothetical protein
MAQEQKLECLTGQYAPIMPPELQLNSLEAYVPGSFSHRTRSMGDYHLLIASEVLDNKELYQKYYDSTYPNEAIKPFVIMDNGLIERGAPLAASELVEAATICSASAVILPDCLGDAWETYERIEREIDRVELPEGMGWMAVMQGNDLTECIEMVDAVERDFGNKIDYWCVPKIIANQNYESSRKSYIGYIYHQVRKPVHLLGFSDYLLDDMQCASLPGVMGIDSAMPVWFGLDLGSLPVVLRNSKHRYDFGKRPLDFWQTTASSITLPQREYLYHNIRRVRQWIDQNKMAEGDPWT